MKHTERINRINDDLNNHFKSNHDAWWVNNDGPCANCITLHHGIGGERINPAWVALRILRREPSVDKIFLNGYITTVYTRETLRWAGYKI